ncbi:MAG: formylglycine-generating enzyme family protein [Pseudoclavibacter sp.]
MIPVPAGSIELRDARANTSRSVDLTAFRIARYPVTWRDRAALLRTPIPSGEDPDAPAHSVSWWDAVTLCNAKSAGAGAEPAYDLDRDGEGSRSVRWNVHADGFRLPTDAEWEWACRAGTSGPHYGPLADIAWTDADAVTSAQRVGLKQPNAFGLFDMLGNVWEWCWDYADPARYADYRVIRGGGWADKHWSVRASVRRGSMPGARLDDVGFRVARGVAGDASALAGQGWSDRADRERAQLSGPLPVGWTPLRRGVGGR